MKLNQALAIETGTKTNTKRKMTDLYKLIQKASAFNGFVKTYEPRAEDGIEFPSESQVVQTTAEEALRGVLEASEELVNITATIAFSNLSALADVVVDGEVVAKDVPATHLIYLEKHLAELATVVAALPTLDPSKQWTKNEATGYYETKPTTTTRTQKIQEALVLYPATPEHPAQTQLISKDVVIGDWTVISQSGAIPAPEKKRLQKRVQSLLEATKIARAKANLANAPRQDLGTAVSNFLLA
jgi:hypothetical protein